MDSFEMSKIVGAACVALLFIVGPKTIISLNQHKSEKAGYTLPTAEPAPAPAPADKAAAAAPAAANGKPAPAPAAGTPAAGTKATAAAGDAPAPAAAPAGEGVAALLAAANADNGKASFTKCAACHPAAKGGPNGVGPNLWGVVGRKAGAIEGFGYSEAIKKKGAEGFTWDLASLDAWVQADDKVIPGNKMVFPGIKDPAAAADLVAYINTLSDNPAPLPK